MRHGASFPWVVLAALLLLSSLPGRALAQSHVSNAAQVHLDRAAEFFGKKEFAKAAEELRAAQALVPAPLNLFNEARAWGEAGRLEEALEAYKKFLAVPDTEERKAKAQTNVAALTKRLYGALLLPCTPAGAAVTVIGPGGAFTGACPWTDRELKVGEYAVSIRASGYAPSERTIRVEPGQTRTETVRLEAMPGHLTVTSPVAGAVVRLDGLEVGQTPSVAVDVSAGVHLVEVAFPRGKPWRRDVTVPQGGEAVVQAEPGGEAGSGRLLWLGLAGGGAALGLAAGITGASLASSGRADAQQANTGAEVDSSNDRVRVGQWLQLGGFGLAAVAGAAATWIWLAGRDGGSSAEGGGGGKGGGGSDGAKREKGAHATLVPLPGGVGLVGGW